MARVVRFHETGSSDVLKLEEAPEASPGEGEVLIHVLAMGLNRAEILYRQGLYLERTRLPSRIGYEASGLVKEVGEGVTDFKEGDYVSTIPAFSMRQYGVCGEEALVPAKALAKMPESIKPEEAASVWMQYLTAYGALIDIGQLTASQAVLITAASSSVGIAAIQMVKDLGAMPIVTTRTAAKRDALLEAGAAHVIVTDEENLVERVRAYTEGKGADIIFDAIAGSIVNELAEAAAYEGTIFLYGALSLEKTPFPFRTALSKGLSIVGYTMMQIAKDEDRLEWGKAHILSGLERGAFLPVVDRVFPLAELGAAYDYMETNQQLGKIVVTTELA